MALLGVHCRAQFATLAGALDSWATEGLIDLLARAVDGATAVVSTLVGRGDVRPARPRCRERPRRGSDAESLVEALVGALVAARAVAPTPVG